MLLPCNTRADVDRQRHIIPRYIPIYHIPETRDAAIVIRTRCQHQPARLRGDQKLTYDARSGPEEQLCQKLSLRPSAEPVSQHY